MEGEHSERARSTSVWLQAFTQAFTTSRLLGIVGAAMS
jgi:hypothetical protein